jgi:hypothetical protein
MSGLSDYLTNTETVSTQLPNWFSTAQESAVNQALNATSPAIQDTAAQSAVNAFGTSSPFAQAQSTLQSIGSGAANPWFVSDTGQVTPNTATPMGGLFQAQQDYFRQIMPDITAQQDAAAIAGGGFGGKMNQAGVAREIGKAYSDLAQKQMQSALQAQQTGVAAGSALGNVGNQLVQSAINTGTYQQNAPYASALNLQNILQKSKLPEDKVTSTDLGLLNQLAGLGTMFSGGLNALQDRVVTNSAGQQVNVPGLLSQLGIKGGLSGLISKAGDLISGPPDYTGTEIENPALPGQEGYGWQYFDTGDGNVTIDPSGNYYQNNELIWSPSWGNYGDTGGGDDGGYTGDFSEYDFEDGGYSPF